jgi:TraM recognition site of TraD and TraG
MASDLYNNSASNATNSILNPSANSGSQVGFSLEDFGAISQLLYFALGIIVLVFVILVGIRIYRYAFYRFTKVLKWREKTIIEIMVPRETSEQVQKEYGSTSQKDSKETLAICEQVFLVMSDYAKKGWKSWLWGQDNFSLEIVNTDQEIKFWIVCPVKAVEVLERQIIAIYPKSDIKRLSKPKFFKPGSTSYVQELGLSTRYELPFRTYKNLDVEPLNVLTNALSGLEKTESAAIQMILTPVPGSFWQKTSQLLALKIQQGQNPKEILFPEYKPGKEIWKFIKSILKEMRGSGEKDDKKPDRKEREIDLTGKKSQISLTPQQQELIKKLEEKASKPGYKFTLRIVGTSDTEAKAKRIVDNILPAFQIFDFRPFNSFKKINTNPKTALYNFTLRSPNLDQPGILNTEEINSIWHLPSWQVQTASIKWLAGRRPPIPLNTPPASKDNIYVGKASSRGLTKDIYMTTEDRFRHIYTLGGSGSGKSITMAEIALQDIAMGNGVCIVDPHGETVDDILRRIPEDRIDDVIYFSPAITDRPLALNMLEFDPKKPEQKTLIIDTLFSIWDKLYDLKKTGGPMFENYMKNSMRLVMGHTESGSTLMEIPKVLTDDDFRAFKIAMCNEQEVIDFWEKEATKAGGEASLENMVPYITSKLAPFVTNDFIKPMIGQNKSVINFREAMDNNKIVLVSLSKGLIGEQSAYLIGMILIGGLLMAGMGRADGLKYNLDGTTHKVLPEDRPPFFIYIDEMQNFLFDQIPKALEEVRKYKVGFYLAHQYVKQVIVDGSEKIKDSIMANCATKFIFRCSADDAKYLESEFTPLSVNDLSKPEKFTFNAICLLNSQQSSPFNIAAYYPDYMKFQSDATLKAEGEERKTRIIEGVKQKYGRPRAEIEQEIKDRSKIFF